MPLTTLPIEELREAEDNPRRISDERLDDLRHSLRRSPAMLEARPLIMDEQQRDIVAGNMRLRATRAELEAKPDGELARWLEQRGGMPVYEKRFRDPRERREWQMRDNAPYGEWIPEELASLVDIHQREQGDMRMLGFGAGDLDGLLTLARQEPPNPGGRHLADPDDAPAAPDEPVTKPGDLIGLGDHRLLCGDAYSPDDWRKLMREETGDAIWTDPPFDEDAPADYRDWLALCLHIAVGYARQGAPVYLCHPARASEAVYAAWREAGLQFAAQLVWARTRIVVGRGDFHPKHEPIVYGWVPGAGHPWLGDRSQGTVLEVAAPHTSERHPAQKPYELVRTHLANSAAAGATVLDPFAGTGTTMVVAERLSLKSRLMEIDPRLCDVIVRRYEALTGQAARR